MPDLLFSHDFPPMGGGIARLTAAIARAYPPGELIVSTGTLDGSIASDAAIPQRVDRIAVPANRLRTMPGLLNWSRRGVSLAGDPAARFAWCDSVRPAGYPARWAYRRTGLPYGIMTYGGDLISLRARMERSRLKHRVMRSILDHAAVFVAVSRWTADECRTLFEDLGLPHLAARVRTVLPGTDPVASPSAADVVERFRRARNLPDGRWIVTVARLAPHKGIDTAIRVVARLVHDEPSLQYLVVGSGDYGPSLVELATAEGVADRVHIVSDVVDDELPAAYAMSELYLGLSRRTDTEVEGFGIAFLEAAAHGLPAVAGASGGTADAVVDGQTGILVEPEDVDAAADGVRCFLNDPAMARRYGEAARRRVEAELNWANTVAKLRSIAEEFGRT
ncbi:MAG: glycosyltransferase family 4 protein [Gemmatimonadales bacterium]